jgi:mannose-6-phosphate isomerase-like protein (cupin superfamily)
MSTFKRPWGTYTNLLDVDYCKVKTIEIKPGKQPSYQYHHKRSEHWIIVSGKALVTIEDEQFDVKSGDHVFVPRLAKHRIKNVSADEQLVFIEVQTGDYFGEDDIVRIEDDFGRA